jgi:hypothetical protein
MTASTPRIDKLDLMEISTPSANIILTSDDKRHQVITPSTNIVIRMPSTGVLEGDLWQITSKNVNGAYVQVMASAGSDNITRLESTASDSESQAHMVLRAKQNAPTDKAHWEIVTLTEDGRYVPTAVAELNLDNTPQMRDCHWSRVGQRLTVSGAYRADPTNANDDTRFRMTHPIPMEASAIFSSVAGSSIRTDARDVAAIKNRNISEMQVDWYVNPTQGNNWFHFIYQYRLDVN